MPPVRPIGEPVLKVDLATRGFTPKEIRFLEFYRWLAETRQLTEHLVPAASGEAQSPALAAKPASPSV